MAEYVQTIGYALEATNALLTAVQRIRGAPQVLEDITDRASQIQSNLRSIKDTLIKMERSVRPIMPPDEYDQLQSSIVSSLKSCERALDERFCLKDEQGNLRSETTIMNRLKVAANGRRILRDRETLDSIISRLTMAMTVASLRLQLEQLDSRENARSRQETRFRNAWNELNKETQSCDELIRRGSWQTEVQSDEQGGPEEPRRVSIGSSRKFSMQQHEGVSPSSFAPKRRRETDSSGNIDSFDLRDVRGQRVSEAVWTGQSDDTTSLIRAVKDANISLISSLLNPNRPEVDVSATDDRGCTALHYAVESGNLEVIRLLLSHNADAGWENYSQETLLLLAVIKNDRKTVKNLLDQGATTNLTYKEDDWSLLHLAVRNATPGTTKFLLKRAPSLKDEGDLKGKTPLHHCAEHCAEGSGIPKALQQATILLDGDADVNAKDKSERPPLYLAVRGTPTQQREKMVKLLLDSGAEFDISLLPKRWQNHECLLQKSRKYLAHSDFPERF